MRALIVAITLSMPLVSVSVMADGTSPTTTTKVAYTTADTDIGTLLDDPAARAVVDKHIPGFSAGDQVDMARTMTLKAIQQFAPDMITDQVLTDIDADLAKLSVKK